MGRGRRKRGEADITYGSKREFDSLVYKYITFCAYEISAP